MIAIEEFNAAADAYTRRVFVAIARGILTMLAGFAVVLPFRTAIHRLYIWPFGAATPDALICLVPVTTFVVLLGGLWVHERSAGRDSRLVCPSCGKSLVSLRNLVVATRNCGHCGKRVLLARDEIA